MVFTPTVKLGEMVREAFEAKGHHAVSVYGHTPAPIRAANIHDFRSGSVPILVNVIVGAEGFDVPEVDCIIQARPTKSWTLYTQMVGRGLRTALGKKDLLVLDVVGAADVHDLNMFPKVVGLRKLAPFESVLEKVEDEFGEKSEQELELHDQKIELEETLLYSPIAWTAYGQEWLAPCDEERLVVLSCEPAGPDDAQPIWMAHVHWVNQSGREELILEHEDRAVVQEHADDYIREYGDVALVQRRRSWRQGAPSEKQARFLSHYRWKVPETRGEASDAITRLRYAINRKKAGV